ncbi:hypothetical protein [Rhizobium jaguaris]|uniref:hypothetical protein n=1 Tax=Rhizobium jaguaris TaxID=1312183 RepID=UPI003CCB08D9
MLMFVDDPTGKLMQLRFVHPESASTISRRWGFIRNITVRRLPSSRKSASYSNHELVFR